MTWNNYSPTPQCSNLLPYAVRLVPTLSNLGSPETLHTYEQAQPDHETYTPLGFILFSMLADHHKEIILMQELWKLGAYKDRYKSSPWQTQNRRTQTRCLRENLQVSGIPKDRLIYFNRLR